MYDGGLKTAHGGLSHNLRWGADRTNAAFRGRYDAGKKTVSVVFPMRERDKLGGRAPTEDDIPQQVHNAIVKQWHPEHIVAFMPKGGPMTSGERFKYETRKFKEGRESYLSFGHSLGKIDTKDKIWLFDGGMKTHSGAFTHTMLWDDRLVGNAFRGRYDASKGVVTVVFPTRVTKSLGFQPTVDDIPQTLYKSIQNHFKPKDIKVYMPKGEATTLPAHPAQKTAVKPLSTIVAPPQKKDEKKKQLLAGVT
jgi:hypothetical protein